MSDTYFEPEPTGLRPSATWTRFIVDYNPCFLLSAVCMLFGCRLLNDAINTRTGDIRGALWLILTINVYEFCLLGVAMLIRHLKGMRRDVGILLVVGVLFLCDIAFVIGDLSTARPGVGFILMLVLTALAVVKTQIVLRLLDAPKRLRTTLIVAGQVALILLLPIVLKQVALGRNGYLPPLAIYAGWWIAGLLPVVCRIVLHYRTVEQLPFLARVYVVVPYLALLGHLLACTWVFKLPFYVACYAPVLLGLAIVAGMSRYAFGRIVATNLEWGLAAVAVLLAIGAFSDLAIGSHNHWATLSALRLTLVGAAVVNLHGLVVMRHPLFAVTFGAMGVAAILGPTVQLMYANARILVHLIKVGLKRLVPQTASEWGVVTVGLAFVLLMVGAVLSLRMKPLIREEVANI